MAAERLACVAICFVAFLWFSSAGMLDRYDQSTASFCATDKTIKSMQSSSPFECADECDRTNTCYGFNYYPSSYLRLAETEPNELDSVGCDLIQDICFEGKWHKDREYYAKKLARDQFFNNYTMKRSYCNDSDLNWGHNITDILNCGVECWKSQECFSFIFADNICQPKAAGCTLLEVGVKGSAFFKDLGKTKTVMPEEYTALLLNATKCGKLKEGGRLHIETNRIAESVICLMSKPSNQTIGCYNVTSSETLKRYGIQKNVIGVSYTDIANQSLGSTNYSLSENSLEFRQICIKRTQKARLTEKMTSKRIETYENSVHELTCAATGFPVPTIQWEFRKCLGLDPVCPWRWRVQGCDPQICLHVSNSSGNFSSFSKLKYRAKQTGTFRCCAYNKQNKPDCEEQDIVVTDIPKDKAFEIKVSLRTGGSFNLVCKTQIYDYRDMQIRFKNLRDERWEPVASYSFRPPMPERSGGGSINVSPDWISTNFNVSSVDSALSTVGLELKFNPLLDRHRGTYNCSVFDTLLNQTIFESIVLNPSLGEPINSSLLTIGIMTPIMLILGILVIVFKCREINRIAQLQRLYDDLKKSKKYVIDINFRIDEQIDQLPYIQDFEVPFENVQLGKFLAQGEFGIVSQATLSRKQGGVDEAVAVKRPRDRRNPEHYKSLIAELKLLSHISRHVNIVCLVGTITKKIPKGDLYVILELCELGSLREYLVKFSKHYKSDQQDGPDTAQSERQIYTPNCKTIQRLTTSDLLGFSYQIARGMVYLGQQNLIHRDLAARNILLTSDLIAKISDFGLAKEFYSYQRKKESKTRLPVKWLSIEALAKGIFSTKSDVWAFGVVMWEIFTLGDIPYADLPINQMNQLAWLQNGFRLKKPIFASDDVSTLISSCWAEQPPNRPNFVQLKTQLSDLFKRWNQSRFNEMKNRLKICEIQIQNEMDLVSQARKKSFATSDPLSVDVSRRGHNFHQMFRYLTTKHQPEYTPYL